MSYEVEPLSKAHDRTSFDCGIDELTIYLQKLARQNQQAGYGTTHVLREHGSNSIISYFTLTSDSIELEKLNNVPPEFTKKYPKRYTKTPVILLSRLAVDKSQQGNGLGGITLLEAIQKSLEAMNLVGATGIIVDSLNEKAHKFYIHFGFIPLESNKLFLPKQLVVKMVEILNRKDL